MPGLPQTDVAGLAERITALKERIVLMVHDGLQTREQSELLFSLLRALKAAKAGTMHRPGLAMTGAWHRHDAASSDGASTATGPHAGHAGHGGRDGR
jgi:hypothetical protein